MTGYTSPGLGRATWLVAEREIRTRLRSKAFLVSTGVLLLIVLAAVMAGGIFSQVQSLPRVAAVGAAVEVAESTGALEVVEARTAQEAFDLVRSEEVDAAIVPNDEASLGLEVTFLTEPSLSIIGALSVPPQVNVLEPASQDYMLVYFVAIGFGAIFMISAMSFGLTIAQSVVEEKQTRIVEILMATVPVRALMAGKIVGNSLLAFGQIALIAVVSGLGMLASGQDILLADIGPSLAWFVIFFAFGFVLLAAIYAAASALVSRQEDVSQVTAPATYLVMIPYVLVIFFNDNPLVMSIMSYVPFSAPVGMPLRVFLGLAEWWEPLLSLLIIVAAVAAAVWVGERIYRNSLLRTGPRVKLREAIRG